MRSLIRPRPAEPGATIGVFAPASPVQDPEKIAQGKRNLESLGFRVVLAPHAQDQGLQEREYLAAEDRVRAEDFHRLLEDPEVGVLMAIRGGYGCMRMLPYIDFERVRKAGKPIFGYSDLTALHMAVHDRAGLLSFHGPMLASTFVHPHPEDVEIFLKALAQEPYTLQADPLWVWNHPSGTVAGPLYGGNLSLLAAVEGSPYGRVPEGALLFLEDVNEELYRIDRLLTSLLLRGVFRRVAAVILGDFGVDPQVQRSIVEDRIVLTGVPVVGVFPFGHRGRMATLPVGGWGELDPRTGRLHVRYGR